MRGAPGFTYYKYRAKNTNIVPNIFLVSLSGLITILMCQFDSKKGKDNS
jgi:hypothetical protein